MLRGHPASLPGMYSRPAGSVEAARITEFAPIMRLPETIHSKDPMSTPSLQGKVALVTGAASPIGIGRHITLALIAAGARVALQHNLGLGGACVVTMYRRD